MELGCSLKHWCGKPIQKPGAGEFIRSEQAYKERDERHGRQQDPHTGICQQDSPHVTLRQSDLRLLSRPQFQVHTATPSLIAASNTTKNLKADQSALFHAPRDH